MNKKTAAFYANIFKRQREERHVALDEFRDLFGDIFAIYSGPSLTVSHMVAMAVDKIFPTGLDSPIPGLEVPAPVDAIIVEIFSEFEVWLDSVPDAYLAILEASTRGESEESRDQWRSTSVPLGSPFKRHELDIIEQTAHPFEYIAQGQRSDWAEYFLCRFDKRVDRARAVGGALFALALIWDLWGGGRRRIFSLSVGTPIEVEAAIQLGMISRHFHAPIVDATRSFIASMSAERKAHELGGLEVATATRTASRENGLKGAEKRHRSSVRKIAFPLVRDLILNNPNKLNQTELREAVRRLQIRLPDGIRTLSEVSEENTVTEWISEIRRAAGRTRKRAKKVLGGSA